MAIRRLCLAAALAALSACASIEDKGEAPPDAALAAIERARVRECPADRVQAGARNEGFGPSQGVESVDIALVPLAGGRALRLRRIVVAPGGVIAWHDHAAVQGVALIVSGEMVEARNSCRDTLLYRAGDAAREDAETAHSWRNEAAAPAVILTAHAVPR